MTKAKSDLQTASDNLAEYQASGLKPDEVVKLDKEIQGRPKRNSRHQRKVPAILQRQYVTLRYKYDQLIGISPDILLRADLKGKIVVVDPKWDFVVLDVGADQGVFKMVRCWSAGTEVGGQGGHSQRQKDRCIANIVPSWKLDEVIEGDVVECRAHPAST